MKRLREPEEQYDSSPIEGQDIAPLPVSKIVGIEVNNPIGETSNTIQCSMPGHAPCLSFSSYNDYEKHYQNAHSNRCIECRKNFPSSHILNLHIEECHDALFDIRRDREEAVYGCFIEICGDKFKTHGKRQNHLVKQHLYPSNYFFAVTRFGIDRRQSMLVEYRKSEGHQRRDLGGRGQKTNAESDRQGKSDGGCTSEESKDVQMTEVKGSLEDAPGLTSVDAKEPLIEDQKATNIGADVDDLTKGLSSLKFVPRTVRLGPKKPGVAPR